MAHVWDESGTDHAGSPTGEPDRRPVSLAGPLTPTHLLALQRSAGNSAAAQAVVQRSDAEDDRRNAAEWQGPRNCTPAENAVVAASLAGAISDVDAASALLSGDLAPATQAAFDRYYRSHDARVVAAVRTHLAFLRGQLRMVAGRSQWQCANETHPFAAATIGAAEQVVLFDNFFTDLTAAQQVRGMIHEVSHRGGLDHNQGDFAYEFEPKFERLSLDVALVNADTLAAFVTRLVHGPPALPPSASVGAGAGVAVDGRGHATWYAQVLSVSATSPRPILRIFNPLLGLSLSLVGQAGPDAGGASMVAALRAGFRLLAPTDPTRGAYLQVAGGPALTIGAADVQIGAEAGVVAGYRWNWLGVSAGAGYLDDPSRPGDQQHLLTLSAGLTFELDPILPH